jgi:hypothetical protein
MFFEKESEICNNTNRTPIVGKAKTLYDQFALNWDFLCEIINDFGGGTPKVGDEC